MIAAGAVALAALVGIVMLVGDRTPKPLKRLSPAAAEALAAHAESLPVPQKPPVI